MIGITFEQTMVANTNTTPDVFTVEVLKKWVQATSLMRLLVEVPVIAVMSFIVNHTAVRIDKLTLMANSKDLVITVDHIYIQSSLNVSQRQQSGKLFQDQQRVFSVQLQVGPVTVADNASKPLVGITTTCLVMVSCQLNRILLEGMDVDIQLGFINVYMDTCIAYYQQYQAVQHPSHACSHQQDLDMSASRFMRLGIKINSISVTVQKMNMENQQIAMRMEINTLRIQALLENRREPCLQLNTDLILLCLLQHRLVEISSMEITAALPTPEDYHHAATPTSSDTLPHTDLLSVTWIINMPLLTLPLKSQTFLDTLAHVQQLQQPITSTTTTNSSLPQKRISNVPTCSLAVVLNSAKMDMLDVDNEERHGYMSSKSLIIRFAGEYMKKSNRNSSSSFDDVPSTSSSSSASRLDSWFAQEEYKWLSGGGSSSSLTARNRSSFHETTPNSKSSIPTPPHTPTTTARWLHLLGRVSRRHQPSSSHNNSSPAPLMHPQQRHQKWIYRLSLKAIMQHVKFGYQCHQQTHDFIRVKNAVFIFKSGMHVIQNHVVLTPGNVIQSEAAIDKPLINVCDTHHGTALSASVFWLTSVPEALQSLRGNNNNNNNNNNSSSSSSSTESSNTDWKQVVVQSISFSLDVTQGSIVAWSVDTARQSGTVQVPEGYIDNAPTHAVYTRMVLDTQKLAFVCEGPYATVDQHFHNEWKARCHMEKLYLHQSSSCMQQDVDIYELLKKPEKQHVILWISQLNFNTKYWQADDTQLSVVFKVKKFGISYSIRNHYACLLLFRSLSVMKHQLKTNGVDSESGLKHRQSTATTPTPLVSLDVSVGRGDIQIGLPQEIKLYLRMDELNVNYTAEHKNMVQFRNIMLLGVSPTHQAKWEQLVELDQVKITKTEASIELKAKKIFASVPYKFVLSEVIDSVIGLVKAIKELQARILEQDPTRRVFTYFGPLLKNNPIAIPHIKLRAKVFTIHFDDDPFEAKLRNILRTGLQEQQRRLAYKEALDEKVYDMLHSTSLASPESASINSSTHQRTSVSDDFQSIRTSSSTINPQRDDTSDPKPSVDQAELYVQIAKAQQNLLAYYSEFWIKHIDETNLQEAQFFEALHSRNNYRNAATSGAIDHALDDGDSRRHDRFLLSKTFTIDIVPRPLHPPLANFTAQCAKVSFKPANFRLEETRSFIHMVGRGVPLDYDFSILIPFHLSIKASKTWIKVRDYPLPLLYVPPSEKTGRVAWTLEGDYVVGDELGNSGGSRIIPITIIPGSNSTAGYCLSAVRTASPLKFYSVIDYHVLTQGMSMICWSVSYNPAIQDILRVLDTLTAAQVDPSPRIGFWDKVRFMIHSQIKIHFTGGGKLAFVIKGARDPYQLLERGAGLAKVWSDDVVWLLGYENEQNEFMQIVSQSYAFGVPDLLHGGFVPQLPDSLQYKQDKMCADDSRVFLKIALRLSDGVRMGIGLSYERLSCHANDVRKHSLCDTCRYQHPHMIDRCRSQVFMPHYHVLFQSVQQVNTHFDMATYDAFRGFRSDFIHLSFSIVKLENGDGSLESPDSFQDDPYLSHSGNMSQNAMYLSPCFVNHFQQWFRLFGSPISIPIRQGKLFPTVEEKARSFGELLNTVKYKIAVNPLAIGFFISDQETYLDMKGSGSVGLKARVNSFSVDLHSRREMIQPNDVEAVQDDSIKTEINFHEAEVELSDIDLRVIRAHHRNTANTSPVSKPQSGKSVAESTAYSEEQSYQGQEASSFDEESRYSFQWIDAKDFVILDAVHKQPFLSRSKIDVLPFAFSPLFYYMKQHDEPGAEKRDYLRRTHDCTIGSGMDSHEFQKTYLNQRAADLDKVIENHDKQLDIIIHAMNVYKNEKEDLTDEHEFLVKKIDHLRVKRYMLHTYIAQMILENELNMTTEDADTRGSPHTTTSSICRRDELSRWELLMGRFKDRYFVHNPQIIWNSSVRDAVYYMRDIYNHRSVQSLNLSARCFKFLEDLVRMAEKQQQWKPDVPEATAESSTSPAVSSASTQALIDRLLAERSKKFVAYNEREEDKRQPRDDISSPSSNTSYDGIHVLDDNADNVNDPDYQYENIPDSYEMQSNYLIDMINPQFICQSERGLDHLILLTNERIHIKGFRIIDNSTSGAADKDVRLVKSRIIVNLDNAQLLVAKRIEPVHSYHTLAPNCYGQFQERHWAVWTQPEQLWYYRELKNFENFQRIATQLSGTMQLDLYNHLRIKINKYNNTLRKSPFEDRTNTIQMHFPHVKLTLNSLQSHILYYTVIHLVLGSDRSAREKTKLNKFRDVMLAAERSDLAETVKQVGVLQNRSRYLLDLHSRFLSELPYLDTFGLQEFNKNKKKMSESLEKLYMVVEAIRSIQTFRRDIHLEESDSAKRFIFTSDEIIWEATMDNEMQSSLCEWKLTNTKYVRLDKPNGSHKNTVEVDQFQIKNTTESPVFVNVLDAYVDPSNTSHQEPDFSRHKMLSGVLDSLPPVGGIPVIQHLEINLLPLHLQISTAFGTAMKDYFFPRVPSTTAMDQQGQNQDQDVFSGDKLEEEEEDQDEAVMIDNWSTTRTNRNHASVRSFGKREGSFASLDMIAKKVKETVVKKRKGKADELTIMKKRSSTNRTFIYVRIPAAKHCISFQGPTQNTFYNLYNFPFKQPKLEYRNKTWSIAEMTEEIQKQFVRAILRHSPALLKKKLLTKNSRELPTPSVPVSRAVSVTSKQSSSASVHSNIELMDDSVIYNEYDDTTSRTKSVISAYTEEDDVDVQSLYSNAPEDEQQHLAELQTIKGKKSHNVDEELLEFYAAKHRSEHTDDELARNSQILFGSSYR
ncbi:proteinase B [Mucor velutinosus]|uniref:Proteinase B n=1 Tax=Mucor velutinosus TaxID=708070 RepID=A0AAN7HZ93_9FUNG|nr:proteinase B [Mucor velutinosus]